MFGEIKAFQKENLQKAAENLSSTLFLPATNLSQQNQRDMTEYYDEVNSFERKVEEIAKTIKNGSRLVIYTGAGISTSASIPDYRGENGTWTMMDRGETAPSCPKLEQTKPTVCHMAIKALVDAGYCQMVVSTNIDGLHRRSGLQRNQLCELHGNCFKEQCKAPNCGQEFLRTFNCKRMISDETSVEERHKTGNLCEECGSDLYDTIIHFNEGLGSDYDIASSYAKEATISLVLGTSMLVEPANLLPTLNPDCQLIIVNRQKTSFDSRCSTRVFADTDDVLIAVMQKLDLEIPTSTELDEFLPIPTIMHEQKYLEFQPILKEVKKKEAKKFERTGNPFVLESLSSQVLDVCGPGSEKNFVYIESCSDCQISFSVKTMKIVLHKLRNCTVTICSSVITSSLEIIQCEGVTVTSNFPLATITVDNSKNCTLRFATANCWENIISCGVENLDVVVDMSHSSEEQKIIFPVLPQTSNYTQYITRITPRNTLSTEVVIREGAGYATTIREKNAADQKQEFLLRALKRALRADRAQIL